MSIEVYQGNASTLDGPSDLPNQGPVDHKIDYKCKVYENGRVAADPETLWQLARFSERKIAWNRAEPRDLSVVQVCQDRNAENLLEDKRFSGGTK